MFPVQESLPFEDLPEIPTASPWCQRWRERTHSWRHVRDGGFDARDYTVAPLDEKLAEKFVITHHYSGSYAAATKRLALYETATGEKRLSGVAAFGVPVSEAVLTNPLPYLRPSVNRV
jgi:hypothetical protein